MEVQLTPGLMGPYKSYSLILCLVVGGKAEQEGQDNFLLQFENIDGMTGAVESLTKTIMDRISHEQQ